MEVANESLVIPDANKAMPKDHTPLASPQIFVTAITLLYTSVLSLIVDDGPIS